MLKRYLCPPPSQTASTIFNTNLQLYPKQTALVNKKLILNRLYSSSSSSSSSSSISSSSSSQSFVDLLQSFRSSKTLDLFTNINSNSNTSNIFSGKSLLGKSIRSTSDDLSNSNDNLDFLKLYLKNENEIGDNSTFDANQTYDIDNNENDDWNYQTESPAPSYSLDDFNSLLKNEIEAKVDSKLISSIDESVTLGESQALIKDKNNLCFKEVFSSTSTLSDQSNGLLLQLYNQNKSPERMVAVYSSIKEPNLLSNNLVLWALLKLGANSAAHSIICKIEQNGSGPDAFTFHIILKFCNRLKIDPYVMIRYIKHSMVSMYKLNLDLRHHIEIIRSFSNVQYDEKFGFFKTTLLTSREKSVYNDMFVEEMQEFMSFIQANPRNIDVSVNEIAELMKGCAASNSWILVKKLKSLLDQLQVSDRILLSTWIEFMKSSIDCVNVEFIADIWRSIICKKSLSKLNEKELSQLRHTRLPLFHIGTLYRLINVVGKHGHSDIVHDAMTMLYMKMKTTEASFKIPPIVLLDYTYSICNTGNIELGSVEKTLEKVRTILFKIQQTYPHFELPSITDSPISKLIKTHPISIDLIKSFVKDKKYSLHENEHFYSFLISSVSNLDTLKEMMLLLTESTADNPLFTLESLPKFISCAYCYSLSYLENNSAIPENLLKNIKAPHKDLLKKYCFQGLLERVSSLNLQQLNQEQIDSIDDDFQRFLVEGYEETTYKYNKWKKQVQHGKLLNDICINSSISC